MDNGEMPSPRTTPQRRLREEVLLALNGSPDALIWLSLWLLGAAVSATGCLLLALNAGSLDSLFFRVLGVVISSFGVLGFTTGALLVMRDPMRRVGDPPRPRRR